MEVAREFVTINLFSDNKDTAIKKIQALFRFAKQSDNSNIRRKQVSFWSTGKTAKESISWSAK